MGQRGATRFRGLSTGLGQLPGLNREVAPQECVKALALAT